MTTTGHNLNLAWANLIIEELVRSGIRTCCMASGSRNSPLLVAAANHDRMQTVMHHDERGAAFYALGFSRATGAPCAWVTTSGTAAANGMPAVIEASNAAVPMLMLTADRPPELRDAGANQAIDQVKLFGDYARWFVDLPCPTRDISPEYVLTTLDQAVHRACTAPAGPVHINCMFREPLLPEKGSAPPTLELSTRWYESDSPYTSYPESRPALQSEALRHIAKGLEAAARGVLVVGQLASPAESSVVSSFAAGLGWPVLADVTSGLRLRPAGFSRVAYYDQVLLSEVCADALAPDFVLHIGGRLTSKRLQQFLEARRGGHYVHVSARPDRQDPGHLVSVRAHCDPANFCAALSPLLSGGTHDAWTEAWSLADAGIEAIIEAKLGDEPAVTEPGVARAVSRHLPKGHGLYLASSMPVRDMDMYGYPEGNALAVAANRGASGIDGTLACAAGYASGLNAPVSVVAGDLACLHDLNSLSLLADLPVTLVIVNNDGGGIFSFLPVAVHEDVFETHFGTPHGYRFEGAANMYGIHYRCEHRQARLEDAYREAVASDRATIIEVRTERGENLRLHRELEAEIRGHLDA
jgi:2-succinyl-5-enolpyruvyl-6-hydroxy-3-cyclohexene-1-carboxylate synthase